MASDDWTELGNIAPQRDCLRFATLLLSGIIGNDDARAQPLGLVETPQFAQRVGCAEP